MSYEISSAGFAPHASCTLTGEAERGPHLWHHGVPEVRLCWRQRAQNGSKAAAPGVDTIVGGKGSMGEEGAPGESGPAAPDEETLSTSAGGARRVRGVRGVPL